MNDTRLWLENNDASLLQSQADLLDEAMENLETVLTEQEG